MYNISFLDILSERRLKTMPPHFSKMKIKEALFMERAICGWIEKKLAGRYCLSTELSIEDDKLVPCNFLGFEDPKEMTYFILSYNQGDAND